MNIACLSGKGGAGKTFVAVNLAAAAGTCAYIDCDVEEPNGHLFWNPEGITTQEVTTKLPVFDSDCCTGCKQCVSFCRFHALVYIKEKPMVFGEVCHSCGGCQLVCPTGAVSWQEKPIGHLAVGQRGDVTVVSGVLNPGEASGVPIIHQALQHIQGVTVLDCPPGSDCAVLETVMASDYCVLVAEPTAFGFHNVQMVYELATLLQKPCGVVINKETEPYLPLEIFCKEHQLPILSRIPYDPTLAQRIGRGEIVAHTVEAEKERFQGIFSQIGGSR